MRETPHHAAMADAILEWYDANARPMPWRVSPQDRQAGRRPDPYHVWLSEIMLQQTTVAAVRDYFTRFVASWPNVHALAAAEDADVMAAWAGLGYYARARNLLKCARVVAHNHDGVFPDTHDDLLSLPGIGPYTAAAVASIAFDRQETVLDGNVERVMARIHDVHVPLPDAKPILMTHAADVTPPHRPGDYAQAVMDLGATICTPRRPACGLCPWRDVCAARRAGTESELPKKRARVPKPVRRGVAYVARRSDGAWLLETRPESGLLGGMLGFPGTSWSEEPVADAPPVAAEWRETGQEVRHTFTHFHLILTVRVAEVEETVRPLTGQFITAQKFRPAALPTVMRKVYDLIAPAPVAAPQEPVKPAQRKNM